VTYQTTYQLWPCPRCQVAIPNTSYTCPNCGLQLVKKSNATAIVAAVVLAVLAVVGGFIVLAFLAAPARTQPPIVELPRTFTGSGIMQSPTFSLAGGDYRADWTAQLDNSSSCAYDLTLVGTPFEQVFVSTLVTGHTGSGTAYLHGVPQGSYYVDSNSDCVWGVTLTRQ
jgi:hypothetical protein